MNTLLKYKNHITILCVILSLIAVFKFLTLNVHADYEKILQAKYKAEQEEIEAKIKWGAIMSRISPLLSEQRELSATAAKARNDQSALSEQIAKITSGANVPRSNSGSDNNGAMGTSSTAAFTKPTLK